MALTIQRISAIDVYPNEPWQQSFTCLYPRFTPTHWLPRCRPISVPMRSASCIDGWPANSHCFPEARGVYNIFITATGIGTLLGNFEVDPNKALVSSIIVNGVISVPILAAMVFVGQS